MKTPFSPEIKRQNTKTLKVKESWIMADFITPNFVYWCIGGCRDTFCSVMKYTYKKIYINDNREQILDIISEHAYEQDWPKPSNQFDDTYRTYEIWVFTDIWLHREALPFDQIFSFFVDHPHTMQWWRRRVSRYLVKKRKEYIAQWQLLHDQIIPWNQIRWIG